MVSSFSTNFTIRGILNCCSDSASFFRSVGSSISAPRSATMSAQRMLPRTEFFLPNTAASAIPSTPRSAGFDLRGIDLVAPDVHHAVCPRDDSEFRFFGVRPFYFVARAVEAVGVERKAFRRSENVAAQENFAVGNFHRVRDVGRNRKRVAVAREERARFGRSVDVVDFRRRKHFFHPAAESFVNALGRRKSRGRRSEIPRQLPRACGRKWASPRCA